MTVVAAAVRLNNALAFPVLGGYDAFAHFTYIWFVAVTGSVPLANQGWEFFQPPLYYELMAALWRAADGLDAETRLRIGTAIVAIAGLVPAAVTYVIVAWRYPAERTVQLLASGSMLFLPMHLYSAGFVGNENLTAVLGSLALLALVWTLREPTTARAATLGVALGLAMLAKFTAIVVVGAAVATVTLRGFFVRRDIADTAGELAVVVVAMLAVCGGYYGRNVITFGTPFPLSRDELFLARVEDSQLQARRAPLEYVLFDPGIVYRPQWPRGLSLNSPRPPGSAYSAMRESIPTGIYANTWFDGFGGVVLAPVTHSEASRRSGQLLLLLALVPTAIMLFGIAVSVRSLWRDGWDDTMVAMLATLVLMEAVLVVGTQSVPTQAAVKATYLMLAGPAFAFMFAVGLAWIARRSRPALGAVAALSAVLAAASTVVFAYGRVLPTEWSDEGLTNSTVQNMYGVLHYAAGDREESGRRFRAAAERGHHLGYENLGVLAFERGDRDAARWFLHAAALRQPRQTRGTREQREQAIRTTQAEYLNTLAVIEAADGRYDAALEMLARSRRYDESIPESAYNSAAIRLIQSRASARASAEDDAGRRRDLARRAAEDLETSTRLDPGFEDARRLHAVALALAGDCDAAFALLSQDPAVRTGRAYPVETGPGDLNAAGLVRRRTIELPEDLSVTRRLEDCRTDGNPAARSGDGPAAAATLRSVRRA